MAKPQQSELRRSGTVPALDPDATEAVLSAQDDPKTSRSHGPVPEEQQPGHRPADDQDKPDLQSFADRLGIPAEGEEPEEAQPEMEAGPAPVASSLPLPVKLVLLGPAVTYVSAVGVYRMVTRAVCRGGR